MLCKVRPWPSSLVFRRFLCRCYGAELGSYKDAFARRMSMAGLKPHHRIALGVSGGPDSMALCVLTAGWKLDGSVGKNETSEFIDGLLGIVVDHRLRSESTDEALLVSDRVKRMGIQCHIAKCDWPNGRPKLGHLQEAARDMRYKLFMDVCIKRRIDVLLIAHHADDQAELLVIRLSRNSGVLGLAGMAFISQLFPDYSSCYGEDSSHHGILLVRPMLEFSKDDMYKICLGGCQDWVEDPTNQSLLFARNRIRAAFRNSSTAELRSDLRSFISACRLARAYIETSCRNMIDQSVTISEFGYVVIDLEKLKPSCAEGICLSRYLTLIVQFVSQRHKPIRGNSLQLLLNFILTIPCKTSLTVAGCYLSPFPKSKGMKIMVSYSVDGRQSSKKDFSSKQSDEEPHCIFPTEICHIIKDAKSHSDKTFRQPHVLHFMHAKSAADILSEARHVNLISESTLEVITSLQKEEYKRFSTETEDKVKPEAGVGVDLASSLSMKIQAGETWHFMGRFMVTWKSAKKSERKELCLNVNQDYNCPFCMVNKEDIISVRHMVEADWLSLAKLLKVQIMEECQGRSDNLASQMQQPAQQMTKHHEYVQKSAQRALMILQYIPIPARKALPVLVNSQGLLVSIPSIGFSVCPWISITSEFKPKVPLGGGYSSYL